jgi:hypothetical protein
MRGGAVDDYVCVTIVGNSSESQADFKSRLTAFWSHYLRTRPDDYEAVYAESTEFDLVDGAPARRYMVLLEGVDPLIRELDSAGLRSLPVDRDDLYSKYEATGKDWFQIEH